MVAAKKSARKPATKPVKTPRRRPTGNSEAPYNVATFAPHDAIGYLLTRAKTVMWEKAERVLEPLGLTLSQWVMITNLATGSAITPSEICKNMSYDAGAMTRLLDRLEKKGFIRRVRQATDRRSITLELTEAGRAIYPNMLPHMVDALNDHVLCGFTAAEARQLESFLKRIIANLEDASREKAS